MDINDLKQHLIGQKIIAVEADELNLLDELVTPWGDVVLILEDGTKLETLGEPLRVSLPQNKGTLTG